MFLLPKKRHLLLSPGLPAGFQHAANSYAATQVNRFANLCAIYLMVAHVSTMVLFVDIGADIYITLA